MIAVMRYTISILVLALVATDLHPQASSGAVGGGKGIYVFLSDQIYSRQHPYRGAVSCRIERMQEGDRSWKEIANLTTPADFKAFDSRLKQAVEVLPVALPYLAQNSRMLWEKFNQFGRFDSLGIWMAYLPVQEAFALVYHDATAIRGNRYLYKASFLDASGNMLREQEYNATSWPGSASFHPLQFSSYRYQNNSLEMEFSMHGSRTPTYLKVERKARYQDGWRETECSKSAYIHLDSVFLMVTDRDLTGNRLFTYLITPLDQYGNAGASLETPLLPAYDFDLDAPVVFNLKAESYQEPPGIQVSWEVEEKAIVKSVRLYKSAQYEGEFDLLAELPTNTISFLDQHITSMSRFYYYVVLTGYMGEVGPRSVRISGVWRDSTPPEAPILIHYSTIPNGVEVHLAIPDRTVKGIRAYRNTGHGTELVPIGGLVPASDSVIVFRDTDPLLDGRTFYAYSFQSENLSHVMGPFSDTLYLRPGIDIAPPAPAGLVAEPRDGNIVLYWPSHLASHPNTEGINVFRRTPPASAWQQINDTLVQAEVNYFADLSANAGTRYEYCIQAVDVFGNKSKHSLPTAAEIELSAIVPISGLRVYPEGSAVVVEWQGIDQDDVSGYKVYRYERGSAPRMVKDVPLSGPYHVTDAAVQAGKLYFYYVIGYAADGRQGPRGEEQGVRP